MSVSRKMQIQAYNQNGSSTTFVFRTLKKHNTALLERLSDECSTLKEKIEESVASAKNSLQVHKDHRAKLQKFDLFDDINDENKDVLVEVCFDGDEGDATSSSTIPTSKHKSNICTREKVANVSSAPIARDRTDRRVKKVNFSDTSDSVSELAKATSAASTTITSRDWNQEAVETRQIVNKWRNKEAAKAKSCNNRETSGRTNTTSESRFINSPLMFDANNRKANVTLNQKDQWLTETEESKMLKKLGARTLLWSDDDDRTDAAVKPWRSSTSSVKVASTPLHGSKLILTGAKGITCQDNQKNSSERKTSFKQVNVVAVAA